MTAENKILSALLKHKIELDAVSLAKSVNLDSDGAMSVIARLESEGLVKVRRESNAKLELTDEGREYAESGAPEYRLAVAVSSGPAPLDDAAAKARLSGGAVAIALQWAIRNKWVRPGKDASGKTTLTQLAKPTDAVAESLKKVSAGKAIDDAAKSALLSRKLVVEKESKTIFVSITPQGKAAAAAGDVVGSAKTVSQLTPQMLKDGSWKDASFREYDLSTIAAPFAVARKNPYKEFLNRIRGELAGMGFREVHGPLVELEFWNMDALFMAQDHPSREIHDIFKLSGKGSVEDKKLVERVRKAHEGGLAGSRGWGYTWNPDVAMQLVLRSQTTAVSARELAKGLKAPARLFCIGRVFRPDEIDWKHFIEFNQCEGIVMDDGLSFRELLGYLKTFATNVFGVKDVKFIPHYYPFTEPSVDLAIKLPDRGWVEAGGAGMFRPELLAGLGVDKPVLAWGLGIDRLALSGLETSDIRALFSTDLDFLRKK